MPQHEWTQELPREPGFYYAVPIEHDHDEAREQIADMASGWLGDPRPLLLVAEVGPDDADEEGSLMAFFAGIGEYEYDALAHDFATVWWYGPLAMPPAIPELGPVRPPGQNERRPFQLPGGWPPEA